MPPKPKGKGRAASKPVGRPTDFTAETAEEICERIATTPRGIDFICDNDEGLPSARTVHRWLNANEEFRQSYVRARERQADLLFDQCLEIADDTVGDTKMVGAEGAEHEAANTEWISRSKLRVDTRLRMAGKLAPKKYGEKITAEHTGADGGPIQSTTRLDMSSLTEDQLRAIASIPAHRG